MDRSTPERSRQLGLEGRARLKDQASRTPGIKARFLAGSLASTPQECLARNGKTFDIADPIFDQVAPCSSPICACTWAPDVSDNPYGLKRTIK